MQESKIKVLAKHLIYNGFAKLFNYELQFKRFDGKFSPRVERELIQRKRVVAVLAVDIKRESIILVEQFRIGLLEHAANPWLVEIPAGLIDDEESDAKESAKRELLEETGLEAKNLELALEYWVSPGSSDEFVSLFYAEIDSTKVKNFSGNEEEHEDIRVLVKPFSEIFNETKQGLITNALTLIALQWFMLKNR